MQMHEPITTYHHTTTPLDTTACQPTPINAASNTHRAAPPPINQPHQGPIVGMAVGYKVMTAPADAASAAVAPTLSELKGSLKVSVKKEDKKKKKKEEEEEKKKEEEEGLLKKYEEDEEAPAPPRGASMRVAPAPVETMPVESMEVETTPVESMEVEMTPVESK